MNDLDIYVLSPKPALTNDPSRIRTNYLGTCMVLARSPEAARKYVWAATGIATNHSGLPHPCLNPALMKCEVLPKGAGPWPPEALVMFPESSGRPDFMAAGPTLHEVWPRFEAIGMLKDDSLCGPIRTPNPALI